MSDIKDGYGFNTELSSGGVAQSITVNGTGLTAGFVGRQSSAPISGQITTACKVELFLARSQKEVALSGS